MGWHAGKLLDAGPYLFLRAFVGTLAPGCPLPCATSLPSWHAIIVDGHSVEELCKAFGQAKHQPTAIIAKTFKGRGITGLCVFLIPIETLVPGETPALGHFPKVTGLN